MHYSLATVISALAIMMFGLMPKVLGQDKPKAADHADRIYFGGPVVTVDAKDTVAEAVAIKDGKILAVGNKDAILGHRGPKTDLIDLRGKTMIPGFVDAHCHPGHLILNWGLPNLNPPPVGNVKNFTDIEREIKKYIKEKNIQPGGAVLAVGYDDSMLEEKRHPTVTDLDKISPDIAIALIHVSRHLGTANSLALKRVGITKDTPDPMGGHIHRDPKTREPTGIVEETALAALYRFAPQWTAQEKLDNLEAVQKYLASFGITTTQEGHTTPAHWDAIKLGADAGRLWIDVISYLKWADHEKMLGQGYEVGGPYKNRLRIGGIKIISDGSAPGRTMLLTRPYAQAPAGKGREYLGIAVVPLEDLIDYIDRCYARDWQVQVHCNGDAAADNMIRAVRLAEKKHGQKDRRPVMIHAQAIRLDQLDAMKELGIIPSFYPSHTFYWGDWYNLTLGRERAARTSPTATAGKKGLRYTIHRDAPVLPPDQLDAIWTAVNRVSRSGVVIGPEERISPLDALKAVTIHSAYQHFEEKIRGSIEPGKLADLVILSDNPLTIDPMKIRDIQVLETIKEGKTIFSRR